MLVRDLGPSANTKYLRSKSSITLSSAKSELSIAQLAQQGHETSTETQACSRIALNVCGILFETLEDTLSAFPDTLLGDPNRRKEFYDEHRNEYRFQRDPESFDAILFYYQSKGILAKPNNVKRQLFEKELDFFGISKHFDRRHAFEKNLNLMMERDPPVPNGQIRKYIWLTMERPRSSTFAAVIGLISIGLIIVSVCSFCAETVPELRRKYRQVEFNETHENTTKLKQRIIYGTDHWYKIETVCISWFTVEYILRLYSAPSRIMFVSSSLGFVDLISIVPYYIGLAFQARDQGSGLISTFSSIRMLRLLRIIRVFKLTRYNEGLRILVMTVYESAVHLRSLFLVILIMAILFATMVFYAESLLSSSKKSEFNSIPESFWYTIITMTTVGYGDVYPQTIGGKFVGALCATFGVLLFCLPSPILVNKFIECYYLRQSTSDDVSPERKAFVESMKEIYFNQ